jgi:DNA ligase (NAD+)
MEGLLELPGIQEKSATNLLRSIDRSKSRPLANIIFALGIRYVGSQTAELLAASFGDLDALREATVATLEAVEGIGAKTAESIVEWTSDERNRDVLDRLRQSGVRWRERHAVASGPLAGVTVLITGRLAALTRGQAEARLKDLGAKIAPGTSKGVDYLIAGADPGSKLDKAQKLGTPVKDEAWLLDLLETGTLPDAT